MSADVHPFERRPHRTLLALAIPVLVSLLAEPVAGLVDTYFVATLGAAPLAALGLATALLSGVFWVFNFLGIGAQTEVANADGRGDPTAVRVGAGASLALALLLGVLLAGISLLPLEPAVEWMGGRGVTSVAAVDYLRIRLLGAPAVLWTLAGFGVLRGLQDMRTPLWIALGLSGANVVLDAVLIPGAGPVPAFGVAGAAWASTASQWGGAAATAFALRRRPGLALTLQPERVRRLLVVGRDLVMRTAALLAFMVLATRAATQAGDAAGAAHQVVRQLWSTSAFVLDAFAAAAQSLVGFFLGAGHVALARRAAGTSAVWSLATGGLLLVGMLALGDAVAATFVPPEARAAFGRAWLVLALAQPLNALAFITDGVLWGASDYRFLRNAMLVATGLGALALAAVDRADPQAVAWIWSISAAWITVRALFGVGRVWPAPGRGPLRLAAPS